MKKLVLSILCLLALTGLGTAQEKEKVWGEATLMAITSTSTYGTFTNTQYMLSSFFSTNLKAPEGASGTLTVPESLGVGPVVPLNIQNLNPQAMGERLYYWGCSEAVLKDQPEVRGAGWKAKDQWWQVASNATADAMKLLGLSQASPIPGTYTMEAGYVGKMSVEMTEAQQFLPALKIVEPTSDKVDTTAPIKVSWEEVAGAGGYHVMAVGKNEAGKDVTWESSYNAIMWQRIGLTKSLKKGLLHGPEHRSCTIPAGIFKGQVSITVTGVTSIATGSGAFSYWGWAQSMGVKTCNMGS